MGADNHSTVVPDDDRATALDGVQNPLTSLDNATLMRKFASSYSAQHHAGRTTGVLRRSYTHALARELDRRGLSGRRALDQYDVPIAGD